MVVPVPGLLTAILDLVIGDGCAACAIPGPPLCDACRDSLPVLAAVGACHRCGHPWPAPVGACGQCIPGVGWARQALAYDPPVPALVTALKDGHRRSLAAPLGALMAAHLGPPPAGVVLVPVPLARQRLADRGFNQAALLAAVLSRQWGTPVRPVLDRAGHGPRQRGSSARDRRAQVRGAFRAVGDVPLHAVLVDDVVTTGATLSEAARVLRAAGAAHVGAVALTRVAVHPGSTRVG